MSSRARGISKFPNFEDSGLSLSPLSISSGIPVGTIWMYDGSDWVDDDTIPGFFACIPENASEGCPDMVDRFVMGRVVAGSGSTGGANSVTLTTAQLPTHDHSITHSHGSHSHTINHGHSASTTSTGAHGHTTNTRNRSGNARLRGVSFSSTSFSGIHSLSAEGSRYSGTANTGSRLNTTVNVGGTSISSSGGHNHNISVVNHSGSSGSTTVSFAGNSGVAGSGNSHENRPAYYSIIFIRKCA